MLLLSTLQVVNGQQGGAAARTFKDEKAKLLTDIHNNSNDPDIVSGLSHVIESRTDHIYQSILSDTLSLLEKEKAIRSLVYFLKELDENINDRKLEMYDVPGALDSYSAILKAITHHQPFTDIFKPLAARRSQLLATAFSQYNGYALMDDIAVYKRLAKSPEFIIPFLESKPGFRYADSLLLVAGASDPMKIVSYLNRDKPLLGERIRSSRDPYMQQIVSLSTEKSASELMPLVTQVADKGITTDEIRETRMDVGKYFQLLVNTEVTSPEARDASFTFQRILRKGLKEKSLSFYVNQINEQHSSPEATRFACVKGLRTEDIYYVITSCGDELYTSSYLGLYKRLMERLKDHPADSVFHLVHYDNFRTFMRLAANYNVLTNFLSTMPSENANDLLKRFIAGIETDTGDGLEKAMDIADCFTGLDSSKEISGMIQNELQDNFARCKKAQQYFGIRLYGILLQVFRQVNQDEPVANLWNTLGNYEVLPKNDLKNRNGEINELVLFYGDQDGTASFNSFQRLFSDSSKWKVARNDSWITIRSRTGDPLVIYANMPLDGKQELDIKAQDNLVAYLQQQQVEPTVLIHRGHSYHLDNTLRRLAPSVKLAILGSCGGYNSAISIATINPDVQIIGSKKTGSKSINDPIIDVINETLLSGQDLSWPDIWEKLTRRFSRDEFTLNLFNEYIPPAKNMGLFVLKLFNHYNKATDLARH